MATLKPAPYAPLDLSALKGSSVVDDHPVSCGKERSSFLLQILFGFLQSPSSFERQRRGGPRAGVAAGRMNTFRDFLKVTSLDPRIELTFSLWVGLPLLVINCVAGVCEIAEAAQQLWSVRELTRPLAEIICAAGTAMTISIPARASPNWSVVMGSVIGHLAVGATVAGASVTLIGVLFATGMLLLASVTYFIMFLYDPSTWPYSLAPAELLALCSCMLALRSV